MTGFLPHNSRARRARFYSVQTPRRSKQPGNEPAVRFAVSKRSPKIVLQKNQFISTP
jgi:hypothetical protein